MAGTDVQRSTRQVVFTPNQFYGAFKLNYRPPNSADEIDNKTRDTLIPYEIAKPRFAMTEILHREDERLKTFEYWPLDWMDKYQLAQTGMFYTGDGDKVKCYFCEVEIGRWEPDDEPVSEHLRWSPNCPLLRRRTTNNEPLCPEALDRLLPPISYDICGANDVNPHNVTFLADGINMRLANNGAASEQANNNGPIYFPDYPEYAIEAARVRSFSEWPRNMKQKPNQLAAAGFFYTGTGDRVKCFSCGGGLKDWDDEDEPWEQHALWLKNCRYLKLIKGQSYIDSVLAKQKENAVKAAASSPVTPVTAPASAANFAGADLVSTAPQCNSTSVALPVVSPIAMKQQQPIMVCAAAVHSDATAAAVDKKANALIPEEKLCKICYGDEYNTAFLPCGHVVACAKCASSVTKCPLCRKPFTDVMRVYFS